MPLCGRRILRSGMASICERRRSAGPARVSLLRKTQEERSGSSLASRARTRA